MRCADICHGGFNSQPPEGGWSKQSLRFDGYNVSTHSRPKAAGEERLYNWSMLKVSTHSRPKAAGAIYIICNASSGFQLTAARRRLAKKRLKAHELSHVSTHSRPKAAG